jgi:hypothetical protein
MFNVPCKISTCFNSVMIREYTTLQVDILSSVTPFSIHLWDYLRKISGREVLSIRLSWGQDLRGRLYSRGISSPPTRQAYR